MKALISFRRRWQKPLVARRETLSSRGAGPGGAAALDEAPRAEDDGGTARAPRSRRHRVTHPAAGEGARRAAQSALRRARASATKLFFTNSAVRPCLWRTARSPQRSPARGAGAGRGGKAGRMWRLSHPGRAGRRARRGVLPALHPQQLHHARGVASCAGCRGYARASATLVRFGSRDQPVTRAD